MEIARLQQVSNVDQLFMIRLDDKKCLLHSVVGGRLAIRGDRDHPSARLSYAPGALESFTTDGVEYNVHSRDAFLKAHGSVVHDPFGAQLGYEFKIPRGGGGRHVGATKSRQLYREDAHGAGSAMHQYMLFGLKPREIEQPLPSSQRSNRNRG